MIIQIFSERLNNELTREATLKGLTMLASKPGSSIQLPNIQMLTPKFIDLLHKVQRQVHLYTLEAILALVQKFPSQFTQSTNDL